MLVAAVLAVFASKSIGDLGAELAAETVAEAL